jgi:hypothetical protein
MYVTLAALLACLVSSPAQPAKEGQPPAKPPMPAGHPGVINNDPTLNWPKARPEDVGSVEAIMAAFYTVPAGNPGEPRDWDRYRSLFTPDARMIPARADQKGGAMAMYVTITDYISLNKNYFEKGGFLDKEVAKRVETFGHMAQVWSTFESRHSDKDPQPYVRGINSVQLLKDADRWWIVNVFWDFEGPASTIPAEYLKNAKE